jgi:D-beta-D-heptose 7-phosphate kinase/D-beta-D-heptose 1-phosphate adenosyltransferase
VDSKSKIYKIYSGATLVTPNASELYNATNIESAEDGAYSLIDSYHIQNVLVTQGAQGMTLITESGKPIHIPAKTHGVVDVTGAGDTVAAVMAIGLANDCDLVECMHLANDAASVVVRKPGVATVTKGELSWKPLLH